MAQDSRTLDEIRRDTERARAGLTETVGELRATVSDTASDLRQRISPEHIKAEVSSYVKTRGEELVETVTNAIQNNPVQAVAVGATLAYPLLKIVRAIPTPVLMVGAGLYLAGSKRGQDLTQRASVAARDLADEAARRARRFGSDAADAASAAQEYASGAMQAARDEVSSRAEQFREAAAHSAADLRHQGEQLSRTVASSSDDLRRRAGAAGEAFATQADEVSTQGAGLASAAVDAVRDTASSLRDSAAETAARLRDRISDTTDASLEAAARMRDRATELGGRAQQTATRTVSEHPLLVAGAGLLVGALIASAIPRLRIERDTMGRASRRVRERAEEAVAQGAELAKQRVRAAYENAAQAAEDQGLTPDAMADNVRDIGQRARKVAEAASSSFETPSQQKH